MLLAFMAVGVGLFLVLRAADGFVGSATALAEGYGWSPLWIGMVVVGFGTSLPELTVSVLASIQGQPGIALGNVVGSNIANIGLILGMTALGWPIALQRRPFARVLGGTLLGILALMGFMANGELARWEATVLLVWFAVQLWLGVDQGASATDPSSASKDPNAQAGATANRAVLKGQASSAGATASESQQRATAQDPSGAARRTNVWSRLVVGLGMLIISSKLFVWGAVGIATGFGISELTIGLTVVALGTSLPELASSFVAARRGESHLVLGNIIGSNVFNLFAVLGISGLVRPMQAALGQDVWILLAFTVALLLVGLRGRRPAGAPAEGLVSRWEGALLLLAYLTYTAWLLVT